MSEKLMMCLYCGQHGFTARGLRQHWCDRAPNIPEGKKTRMLTKHEWERAVFLNTHGPWAVDLGDICFTSDVADQVQTIRQADVGLLYLIIANSGTKPTSLKAAQSRLRRLEREETKSTSTKGKA